MLVDVTNPAKEAGFSIPLALTARVYSECVYWPETEAAVQDESGRLWDVLFMAAVAARAAARRGQGGRINFELHVVPRGGLTPELKTLSLQWGRAIAGSRWRPSWLLTRTDFTPKWGGLSLDLG